MRSHRTTPLPSFEISARERINALERNQKTTADLLKECREMLTRGPTFDDYAQAMQKAMEKDAKIAELTNRLEEAAVKCATSLPKKDPRFSTNSINYACYPNGIQPEFDDDDSEFLRTKKPAHPKWVAPKTQGEFQQRLGKASHQATELLQNAKIQSAEIDAQNVRIDNMFSKTTEAERKVMHQNRQMKLILGDIKPTQSKEEPPRSTVSNLKKSSGVLNSLATKINQAVSSKEKTY